MNAPGNVASLARTLEQELSALLRGASLECIVCGEFVMHARNGIVFCPECGTQVGDANAFGDTALSDPARVHLNLQAG